ncbi:hypothetical protein CfE428DRAFT_1759 [Chthoniobacter flavus Ellin428]|uniref:Glycosyltransferase RgtA/B/C/D-like domain-containing protein n=1 Tax=Chthoniobacter flavus Ellin428 TaxID=497964 RepID=B4CYM1_9BACT|nr:hypothetical protein [Chthoniobacter flavus]EDY20562.1 hypothetical protein CfE428DRAFT_1759 [Chthoniobacter flavus Ellin428]
MTSPDIAPTEKPPEPSRVMASVLMAIELLVLCVVLALAWKAWRVWPRVPLADPDTWGYLNPALTWLSGQGFQQTDGRDWLYPTMLAMFLKTTGTFTGIAAWQKFLGLCSGIFMAITWRCWVSLLPFNRWVRFVLLLLGVWPIYVALVNQQTIFFAMSLRPESVLPLFVYAQLACVMGYCKYRWQTPRSNPAMLLGIAAIALAYGCLVLKPSWYFATITTSLPVAIGFFGRALPLRVRLWTPILGVVAALAIFSLPARFFVIRDGASVTLLPDALLCVHAEFVEHDLNAKLAAMPDSDPGKTRLRDFVGVLDSEIHNAKNQHKVYEKLGFNADYLMHSDTLSKAITVYAGDARGKFRKFCLNEYFSAVLHAPLAYTQKILRQFMHFVQPESKTFFDDQVNLSKAYHDTATVWNGKGLARLTSDVEEMYVEYGRQIDLQAAQTGLMAKYPLMRKFRDKVAAVALPLELLFLGSLILTVLWSRLHKLRIAGWAVLFLFLAPAGNAFGVCIVHTLDIYRYRATYGGYLLFSLAAMAVFIGIVVVQAIASQRVSTAK